MSLPVGMMSAEDYKSLLFEFRGLLERVQWFAEAWRISKVKKAQPVIFWVRFCSQKGTILFIA